MPVRFCFISIQPSTGLPIFLRTRRPSLFAPRPPRTLVSSFRGAKSSHSRRRISPLALPAASSLCSPLPARPCDSVPGNKIFTFPPPVFSLPRDRRPPLFAPHSPLTLVPPFRGAKSLHSRRRISPLRTPGGSSPAGAQPHPPDRPAAPLPTHAKKAPGNAIAARCFSLSSFSIIPIPLLPPAQS